MLRLVSGQGAGSTRCGSVSDPRGAEGGTFRYFMKTQIASIVIGMATAILAAGAEVKQALAVETPQGWKVEFKGDERLQFYTVTRKEGDMALLMFSRSPVPGNVAQIPERVEALAKGFVTTAKESKDFTLEKEEYVLEKIEGEAFSGQFVVFQIKGGILQAMFMVGDEGGIWSGQFTGTKERWAEALEILKKLKKNG